MQINFITYKFRLCRVVPAQTILVELTEWTIGILIAIGIIKLIKSIKRHGYK